jgi:RimJ/RimL family protein N-acetyltransferase
LRHDDAEPIARACADPEIARWTQVPVPYHLTDAEQFIADRGGEDHVWAIEDAGLCGVIGLRNTRDTLPGPITQVGYWVAPWARGRGLATSALIAVRDELARNGYQRIDWEALAGNEASVRVATRAGFVIEGYRRQALVQRGRVVDAVVGGWTAVTEVAELVAGAWQIQPVASTEVSGDLRPLASNAVAVWMVRAAVGGEDNGLIMAIRTAHGVHVHAGQAPRPAVDAVIRYLQATGEPVLDEALPTGWL